MLMRTDPFRELDRLTQQVLGTNARPAAMPMDAYRHGDTFYICLDLPGINPDSIDLTVEQNVLNVRAERAPAQAAGVLTLTIPVREAAKPRSIQVTSSDTKHAVTA
jgi:HSP20 family protein